MNSLLSNIENGCNSPFFPYAGTKLSRSQQHWIISINFVANIVWLGHQTSAKTVFGQRNLITSSVFKAQDVS